MDPRVYSELRELIHYSSAAKDRQAYYDSQDFMRSLRGRDDGPGRRNDSDGRPIQFGPRKLPYVKPRDQLF